MADPSRESQPGESPASQTSTPPRRRRHWGRWLGGILIVIILILIGLFLAAPTILSTGPGKGFVMAFVNGSIAGSASADDLNLSWWGGQSIKGLTLRDPQGQTVAVIDDIDIPDASLWDMAWGSRHLGNVTVAVDHADIVKRADGTTNLQAALASPKAKAPRHKTHQPAKPKAPAGPMALGDLSAHLHVTAPRITYQAPDVKPIQMSDLDLTADVPDPQHIKLDLTSNFSASRATQTAPPQPASTNAGSSPGVAPSAGRAEAHFTIRDAFDSQGVAQLDRAAIEGNAQAAHMPTALIDALLKRPANAAKLVDVLGPMVSAKLAIKREPGKPGPIKLDLESPNAKAHIEGVITPDRQLHLTQDATAQLHVTPRLSEVMLKRINPMLAGVGAAAVPIKLVIQKQGFTMPLTGLDWSKIHANAHLDASELTLLPKGFAGRVLNLLQKVNVLKEQSNYAAQLSNVNFSIDQGKLAYDHLQLTLEGVGLGFSGNVNLLTNQLHLNLALAGKALGGKALQGLSIPITGSINNPTISQDAIVQALTNQAIQKGLGKDLPPQAQQMLGQILSGHKTDHTAPRQENTQEPVGKKKKPDAVQQLLNLGGQILQQQQEKQREKKDRSKTPSHSPREADQPG